MCVDMIIGTAVSKESRAESLVEHDRKSMEVGLFIFLKTVCMTFFTDHCAYNHICNGMLKI